MAQATHNRLGSAPPTGGMQGGGMRSQTVVVTGATQGIGREMASALAGMGATVVLACRNLEAAEIVASEIRSRHPGAAVVVGPRLDLADQRSVRAFAAEYRRRGWPLHCLVNNAGANHYGPERWHTPEGVPGLAQINYLGPYTLTRLLEETLQRSAPSRVVNVSSVTHRYARFPSPASFLTAWAGGDRPGVGLGGDYPITKLANALFAFELQRRLGASGVESCAVDPGGVASNIWQEKFSRPPLSWFISSLYAPPSDGAAAVVHAASVDWEVDSAAAARVNATWNRQEVPILKAGAGSIRTLRAPRAAAALSVATAASSSTGGADAGGGTSSGAAEDLRFYARGLFSWPTVTSTRGNPGSGALEALRGAAWSVGCLIHSAADWPLRRLTGGQWPACTVPVPAAPVCYDKALAAELWDASADAVGLPRQPILLAYAAKTD